MRKSLFFVLFLTLEIFASDEIIMGMRNNRYAFLGYKRGNFGAAYENSVLTQNVKLQYARFSVFYTSEFPFNISLAYAIYGGFRYDRDFHDFGAQLSLDWNLHRRFFQLTGIVRPFYDSDYGHHVGYLISARTFFLQDIGVFAAFKNIPEYRDVERRISGGLIFKVPKLMVIPEISRPLSDHTQFTRVSVSFLYNLSF